jgi:hypothetical protein
MATMTTTANASILTNECIYYLNKKLAQFHLQTANENCIADSKADDGEVGVRPQSLLHYNRMVNSLDALLEMNAHEETLDFLQINDHLLSHEFQLGVLERIEKKMTNSNKS